MADTEFSQGFTAQTQTMIAELRAELVPYEDGSAQARPGQNEDWENATVERIAQIKLEIETLEDSLARQGKTNA